VRQGLARLIDSYAEGLLEKHEFEPRITRLRQRLTQLEEQRQQLIDVTALQTEIRLIVGRLEDFAAKMDAGLEDSDWLSKREMIRALVKRVEVTPDRVNVVFRVDAYPGEASPEKKSLQLRRGSMLTRHCESGLGRPGSPLAESLSTLRLEGGHADLSKGQPHPPCR
jgi:site-specific DNA recombinase